MIGICLTIAISAPRAIEAAAWMLVATIPAARIAAVMVVEIVETVAATERRHTERDCKEPYFNRGLSLGQTLLSI